MEEIRLTGSPSRRDGTCAARHAEAIATETMGYTKAGKCCNAYDVKQGSDTCPER